MNLASFLTPRVFRFPCHKNRSLGPWRASATSLSGRGTVSKTDSFRVAPSDFAFLWEECKRCFYLKVHKKLSRPRAPFPSVFGTIDLSMKRCLRGLTTTDVIPCMPRGTFLCEDNDAWVECKPVVPPGRDRGVYIRGMVSEKEKING